MGSQTLGSRRLAPSRSRGGGERVAGIEVRRYDVGEFVEGTYVVLGLDAGAALLACLFLLGEIPLCDVTISALPAF
jgi:hypothetical protein